MDTIAARHRRCFGGFVHVISILRSPDHRYKEYISLSDASNEFDRYKLWSGNVGAAHDGSNYRISLDYRLKEAPFFKEQISSILSRLDQTV